ncbi:MAG TPA: hypothetical protein DIU35_08280 [Candidatus Latescibacteria bacterium]|nr:hypothetical protein [Gemmatimonadota bacterium]HCR17465.1 hypothetical protein [Candidatus Latescibacterota bacterium]
MPNQLSVPNPIPSLGHARPSISTLTSIQGITSNANGATSSTRAAGIDLITRVLNTSGINGLGGHVDFTA